MYGRCNSQRAIALLLPIESFLGLVDLCTIKNNDFRRYIRGNNGLNEINGMYNNDYVLHCTIRERKQRNSFPIFCEFNMCLK